LAGQANFCHGRKPVGRRLGRAAALDAGADVVCLMRDLGATERVGSIELDERVKVVRVDVRDQELIERTLGEYEIDTGHSLGGADDRGNREPNPGLDL